MRTISKDLTYQQETFLSPCRVSITMITARYIGHQNSDFLGTTIKSCQSLRAQTAKRIKETRLTAAYRLRKLKKRAYRQGYSDGLNSIRNELSLLLKQAENLTSSSIDNAEEQCIVIALAVAEEIVASSLADKKELLSSIIKRSLRELNNEFKIMLEVNPAQQDMISKSLTSLAKDKICVKINNEIPSDCANIKTSTGTIEINWNHHLDLIKQRIVGAGRKKT